MTEPGHNGYDICGLKTSGWWLSYGLFSTCDSNGAGSFEWKVHHLALNVLNFHLKSQVWAIFSLFRVEAYKRVRCSRIIPLENCGKKRCSCTDSLVVRNKVTGIKLVVYFRWQKNKTAKKNQTFFAGFFSRFFFLLGSRKANEKKASTINVSNWKINKIQYIFRCDGMLVSVCLCLWVGECWVIVCFSCFRWWTIQRFVRFLEIENFSKNNQRFQCGNCSQNALFSSKVFPFHWNWEMQKLNWINCLNRSIRRSIIKTTWLLCHCWWLYFFCFVVGGNCCMIHAMSMSACVSLNFEYDLCDTWTTAC